MPKLTQSYVDKAAAPEKGYAFYWDTDTRGFGLRVSATGNCTYVVQGRLHGKSIRMKIGRADRWTPDLARKEAKEVLRMMDRGTDPREAAKEEAITKITLRQVADAYFRDRDLKDSTREVYNWHVENAFKAWKDRPIVSITRAMVTERFNEIRDSGTFGDGPAPAAANLSFRALGAFINYAIEEYRHADGTPLILDNPVRVLKKKWSRVRERTGRIPEGKVGACWNLLCNEDHWPTMRDAAAGRDLVKFLLLTGARVGEASSLTWDRVNLDEKDSWWHLPDPKNRRPVWFPLSTVARELLEQRPRSPRSPYVFASYSKSGHIVNPRGTMDALEKIAGVHLGLHDLRRTTTNIGIACAGIDVMKMELLTGHVPTGVTARHYLDTERLTWLAPEAQQVADWIVEQARIAAGKNVVPLRNATER